MEVVLHSCVAIFIIYLIYLVGNNWRYYYLLRKLPSPKGHYIFGNVLSLHAVREDVDGFVKLVRPLESSSIICFWIFHIPIILLTKHTSAEIVLSSNQEIEKADLYHLLHPWLGLGLLTSTGNKWRSHRKLLTPSFHFRILENFIPIFNEQSQTMVSLLSKNVGKGTFDVYSYVTRCTLDIICETAMGKRMQTQLGKNTEYLNALTTVADIVLYRVLHPWLLTSWIFELSSFGQKQRESLKILHEFTENVIKERRQEYEKIREQNIKDDKNDCDYVYGQKNRKAFLDTLLEASFKGESGMSDDMIREETDTFMFEGHDTTAVNISWTIYLLGWCPSVQEAAHQELGSILVHCDSDRPITYEDIHKMKYLGAVIKETLRLIPSVPIFGRRLINETNIDGYTFPRGAEVMVAAHMIGSDESVYTNPSAFDPTRFLHDDFQKRHPYAYVPFSAGPRNCIGQKFAMMEEKIVLANILRNFEIRSYNSPASVKAVLDLVYRPVKGMNISLERRHQK